MANGLPRRVLIMASDGDYVMTVTTSDLPLQLPLRGWLVGWLGGRQRIGIGVAVTSFAEPAGTDWSL